MVENIIKTENNDEEIECEDQKELFQENDNAVMESFFGTLKAECVTTNLLRGHKRGLSSLNISKLGTIANYFIPHSAI